MRDIVHGESDRQKERERAPSEFEEIEQTFVVSICFCLILYKHLLCARREHRKYHNNIAVYVSNMREYDSFAAVI